MQWSARTEDASLLGSLPFPLYTTSNKFCNDIIKTNKLKSSLDLLEAYGWSKAYESTFILYIPASRQRSLLLIDHGVQNFQPLIQRQVWIACTFWPTHLGLCKLWVTVTKVSFSGPPQKKGLCLCSVCAKKNRVTQKPSESSWDQILGRFQGSSGSHGLPKSACS